MRQAKFLVLSMLAIAFTRCHHNATNPNVLSGKLKRITYTDTSLTSPTRVFDFLYDSLDGNLKRIKVGSQDIAIISKSISNSIIVSYTLFDTHLVPYYTAVTKTYFDNSKSISKIVNVDTITSAETTIAEFIKTGGETDSSKESYLTASGYYYSSYNNITYSANNVTRLTQQYFTGLTPFGIAYSYYDTITNTYTNNTNDGIIPFQLNNTPILFGNLFLNYPFLDIPYILSIDGYVGFHKNANLLNTTTNTNTTYRNYSYTFNGSQVASMRMINSGVKEISCTFEYY